MSDPVQYADRALAEKVIQAYIQSNSFWPQTRASFVLVMLGRMNYDDVVRLGSSSTRNFYLPWRVDEVIAVTDRIHKTHNISTVLPTTAPSVSRELRQSCKVLFRTLNTIVADLECDQGQIQNLKMPAKNIWHWIKSSEFILQNKCIISGPSSGTAAAMKLLPEHNPGLIDFHRQLFQEFNSGYEFALLSALEVEILHAITIVRSTATIGGPGQSHA